MIRADRLTFPQRLAHRRNRVTSALAEQAEALLHFDAASMSRRDRERWASARRWADLGECVVSWLYGEIVQTPGHCGPPCDETLPLIPVLAGAGSPVHRSHAVEQQAAYRAALGQIERNQNHA
jgi:hypothetical protein